MNASELRSNLLEKKARIEALRRALIMAVGGLRSEHEQKAQLEKTVGEAKWRLLQKQRIDDFLEGLLEEAHARRIGYFERLLTALVLEVMPGESPIKLELMMKSGAPWLDIVSELAKGITEDVYEDQGGALTNIIILGLRMIAIAKSGTRRILFLDESDCWVENHRVPAFYNVVRDAAKKIGFQCFAISHHDIRAFQGTKEEKLAGNGIRVASLYGHPKAEGGVHIENDKTQHRWADDEIGLRSIRMQNVQGYEDEIINLAPGVNSLVGPNNHGKSTVLRLVRAVFFGEIRASLVTKGKDSCQAEFAFEKGRTLRFTRNNKKGPANLWELIGPNGSVVEEQGMKYSTAKGSGVPEWVPKIFGIGPVDGLDPQAIKQKEPIFLLNKGGHVRASVLSIGQETGHIQTMIQLHKKRCAEDNGVIKEGEELMNKLLGRIAKLEAVSALEPSVGELEEILQEALQALEQAELLEAMFTRLTRAKDAHAKTLAKEAIFENLPVSEDVEIVRSNLAYSAQLDGIFNRLTIGQTTLATALKKLDVLKSLPVSIPDQIDNKDAIRVGKALVIGKTQRKKIASQIAILAKVPEDLPVLTDSRKVSTVVEHLQKTKQLAARGKADVERNTTDLAACEHELHQLMEGMGHSCPLCGQHVDDPRQFVGYKAEEVRA
jgi:hypothetical protein